MNIYVSYVIFIPNAECLYCYLGGRNGTRYEAQNKTQKHERKHTKTSIQVLPNGLCLIHRSVVDGFKHETKIKRSAFSAISDYSRYSDEM